MRCYNQSNRKLNVEADILRCSCKTAEYRSRVFLDTARESSKLLRSFNFVLDYTSMLEQIIKNTHLHGIIYMLSVISPTYLSQTLENNIKIKLINRKTKAQAKSFANCKIQHIGMTKHVTSDKPCVALSALCV